MYDGAERGPFPSEPRVYRISAYGNQSMSSSTRQQDLADYPALGRAANDYAYIDQVDSATDEEEDPLSNLDDDSISDQFDDLRVEDEDWEIAERGLSFFLFLSSLGFCLTCFFFDSCRLHQTVQSASATRRRAIPTLLSGDNPGISHQFPCRPSPRYQSTNSDKHGCDPFEERQDWGSARRLVKIFLPNIGDQSAIRPRCQRKPQRSEPACEPQRQIGSSHQ